MWLNRHHVCRERAPDGFDVLLRVRDGRRSSDERSGRPDLMARRRLNNPRA